MLHKNVIEKGGFRTLVATELEAVSGGQDITVTGTRPQDPWVTSIPGEALLGLQGDAWVSTSDLYEGSHGDGGGEVRPNEPDAPNVEPTEPFVRITEDTPEQEFLEDVVENWLEEEITPGVAWVVEYGEFSGVYHAQSEDGALATFSPSEVQDVADNRTT